MLAVAVAVALGYEIARFFLFSGFHAWGDRVRESAGPRVCIWRVRVREFQRAISDGEGANFALEFFEGTEARHSG